MLQVSRCIYAHNSPYMSLAAGNTPIFCRFLSRRFESNLVRQSLNEILDKNAQALLIRPLWKKTKQWKLHFRRSWNKGRIFQRIQVRSLQERTSRKFETVKMGTYHANSSFHTALESCAEGEAGVGDGKTNFYITIYFSKR